MLILVQTILGSICENLKENGGIDIIIKWNHQCLYNCDARHYACNFHTSRTGSEPCLVYDPRHLFIRGHFFLK